jgi:hypothetical protein
MDERRVCKTKQAENISYQDMNIFKGTHFGYSVTEANPECNLAVADTLLQLAEFSIGACPGGVGHCANLAEKGVLLLLLLLLLVVVAGDGADAIARQVRLRQAERRSRFPRATPDAILREMVGQARTASVSTTTPSGPHQTLSVASKDVELRHSRPR